MKISEIQELTIKELEARKRELRHESFNLRIQQQAGQLEKPHMLRTLRRDAARVETVISRKKAAAASGEPAAAAPAAKPAAKKKAPAARKPKAAKPAASK